MGAVAGTLFTLTIAATPFPAESNERTGFPAEFQYATPSFGPDELYSDTLRYVAAWAVSAAGASIPPTTHVTVAAAASRCFVLHFMWLQVLMKSGDNTVISCCFAMVKHLLMRSRYVRNVMADTVKRD